MPALAIFGISVGLSFVVWGIIAAQYLWPALRSLPRARALRPLLLLHGFRFIGLAFLVQLWESSVTDAGLRELRDLKHLRRLNLGGTKVTNAGLNRLSHLMGLRHLGLSGTKVTDEGLKVLGMFEHLESLDLSFTKITDTGLKECPRRDQLKSLNLQTTGITDAGVRELTAFKQLQALNLCHTQITPAGLKQLAAFKQLRELYVLFYGDRFTEADIKELRKALPDAYIYPDPPLVTHTNAAAIAFERCTNRQGARARR
jgi:hypothetical protein